MSLIFFRELKIVFILLNSKLCLDCSKMESHKKRDQFKLLIEGNIGSGKSTFIEYLSNYNEYCRNHMQSFPEPLKEWRDLRGINLFELFNENPKRWSYAFETYVVLTMLKYHQLNIDENKKIKIMERSLYSAKEVFTECLKTNKMIKDPEFCVLSEWFDYLISNEPGLEIDLIIYIRSKPSISLERINARGRPEEAQITHSYLQSLKTKYDHWLLEQHSRLPHCPVWTVETDASLEHTQQIFNEIAQKIIELTKEKLNI